MRNPSDYALWIFLCIRNRCLMLAKNVDSLPSLFFRVFMGTALEIGKGIALFAIKKELWQITSRMKAIVWILLNLKFVATKRSNTLKEPIPKPDRVNPLILPVPLFVPKLLWFLGHRDKPWNQFLSRYYAKWPTQSVQSDAFDVDCLKRA